MGCLPIALASLLPTMPDCHQCDREFIDENAFQQVVPIYMLSSIFLTLTLLRIHQSTDEIRMFIESHIIAATGRSESDPASTSTSKPCTTGATPAPGVSSLKER